MTERPVLFSGPMVRALLDGRKTQTRRIVKRAALDWLESGLAPEFVAEPDNGLCPYGVPGDRLWVRESGLESRKTRLFIHDATPGRWWTPADGGRYGASYGPAITRASLLHDHKVRPSIHMPRWASRLTLTITEVRAERLQDISEADAMAEGAEPCANGVWFDRSPTLAGSDARGAYYCLWEHINGKGSWAANPWVWAVTFEVQARP